MRSSPVQRIVVISIISVGFFSIGSARAQDLQGGVGRQSLNPEGQRGRKPAASQKVYIRVPVNVYIKATPTTGTLFVAARPNAHITVEPVRGGTGEDGIVPANENFFIFGDLKLGRYRVAASLEGYKPDDKLVDVVPNAPKGVSLNLEPVLYQVTITATNVENGEVRYAPVEPYSDPQTGEKKYRQAGLPRLVVIKGRRAILPELHSGTYGVDISAREVGFETLHGTVTVPGSDNKETIELSVKLNNVRSTDTFSSLTADQWDLPTKWNISSLRVLSVNGSGVAVPRLETYRHYTDFELVSDVKMVNGMAASFVVRAIDKQNYYLITLTGPNAAEPYLLSGYVVEHGIPERLQSIPISHFKSTIKVNQGFTVKITVKDNNIDVKVAEAGEYRPLGVLKDSNRHFPIGAPGIAGSDNEQTQFGSFNVCVPECPK
jgi:hypothetical protein